MGAWGTVGCLGRLFLLFDNFHNKKRKRPIENQCRLLGVKRILTKVTQRRG